MTAIGVLRAAYMQGLRVPQDLSVIGLDDIAFAEYTLPPLTTIRLSRTDLARAAFNALHAQIEDAGSARLQREFLVSTSLVVRDSTARPPPFAREAESPLISVQRLQLNDRAIAILRHSRTICCPETDEDQRLPEATQ